MSSSSSTPNTWSPYETYKDCSQGICSMYCPQWCYFIFPPPPPFAIDDDDDDSSTDFSPLIIALLGILASAFILVSYYTIISKYCRRRRQSHASLDFNENRDEINHNGWQPGSQGLDESLIKAIAVCKFKKNEGLIEGTDCSVCLSEFLEDESLRLLPKCNHAFHVPCIDTWLKSHSSCPLCRANNFMNVLNFSSITELGNPNLCQLFKVKKKVGLVWTPFTLSTEKIMISRIIHNSASTSGSLKEMLTKMRGRKEVEGIRIDFAIVINHST
ncbi:hypothetical protein GOBAR_DD33106 [Gossypium barbadense]|nr:hypothetical protein GOBAR_DD33106 [Gossypium barbadense]